MLPMCNHYSALRGIPEYLENFIPGVRISDDPLLPGLEIDMYPKKMGAVVTQSGLDRARALRMMRWGVPQHFGKGALVTNAREDKLLKSSMWKKAAQLRRCLVPASAYYEPGPGPVGSRGEVAFRAVGREAFCFAGLWDLDKDGKPCFALVTTAPNEAAAKFHDRMPVALTDAEALDWVGDQPLPDENLMALCKGLPAEALTFEIIPAKPKSARVPKKKLGDASPDLFGV